MHFEKLTKGTPHEPLSLMNNNTYPPWLINHQGIQPIFFFEKKPLLWVPYYQYHLISFAISFCACPFFATDQIIMGSNMRSCSLQLMAWSWCQ